MAEALCVALAAAAALAASSGARAHDFYKGKTIAIIVSTDATGSYDLAARTLARFMPRHIPGVPSMIVKNMPGGGHTRATNYLYANAPQDGTTIGTVSNTIPMNQVVDGTGVYYDAAKFNWLGSVGISNLTIAVWSATGIKSFDEVFKRDIVMGAAGTSSGSFLYPNALNNVLGTRFKIVAGYQGTAEVDLALSRGEVEGRGGASYSQLMQEHPEWLKQKLLTILAQIGYVRDPAMADVPLVTEIGKTDEQRQVLAFISSPVRIGRPFFTTPNVPPERLAILRKAFDDTMEDKDFMDEAQRLSLDIVPMKGDALAEIVRGVIDTPPAILDKARAAMTPPTGAK